MSLNHLMYPYVPDGERLDIKVCDIYCCNVFSENPITYFNMEQRAYEQLSDDVVVLGTEGEKSIFNTTGAIGSNIIPANSVRVGSKYKMYSHGTIETNGANQSFILNTKLGTAIIETTTITLPNLNNGSFYELTGDILLYQIGDAGTAVAKSFFNFNFTDQQGDSKTYFIDETNNTTFQTTADATADITINWNNQNVANIFKCHSLSFSKIY
jgi:hypothetical protein